MLKITLWDYTVGLTTLWGSLDYMAHYTMGATTLWNSLHYRIHYFGATFTIADLKIKVSKCEFFKKHVSYLGFLIGETGIRCDRSKVEAITDLTCYCMQSFDFTLECICQHIHKWCPQEIEFSNPNDMVILSDLAGQ